MKTTSYSMNLSQRYVPDWGSWEVIREIISNAIDADAKWEISHINDDHVEIFTSTEPKMGHLLVIGGGTKTPGEATIGQFGEGFKLAALACVRAQGTFIAMTPGRVLNFKLEHVAELDEHILYCHASNPTRKTKIPSGCNIRIQMRGIGTISSSRFLKDRTQVRIAKAGKRGLTLYVKGVWVADDNKVYSLYDWNLTTAGISRDRSVVDHSAAGSSIATWYENYGEADDCVELIENLNTFEVKCLDYIYAPRQRISTAMVEAIHRVHGDKVCTPGVSDRANEYATLKGYNILHYEAAPGILKLISGFIKTADDLLPKTSRLTPAPTLSIDIRRLDPPRKILNLLRIPAEIFVFRNIDDAKDLNGRVQMRVDGSQRKVELWVNEKLLEEDQEQELVTQTLVLASSSTCQQEYGTLGFEATLANIAGKLATAWLNDNKEPTNA